MQFVSCVLAVVAKVDITNADSEVEYIASDIWLPIVIHMGMDPPEAEISMEWGFTGGWVCVCPPPISVPVWCEVVKYAAVFVEVFTIFASMEDICEITNAAEWLLERGVAASDCVEVERMGMGSAGL